MVTLKQISERAVLSFITLFSVMTITFALIRLIPGSPESIIRAQLRRQHPQWSLRKINRWLERYINYDPTKPLWRQYIDYLVTLSQGDLGHSIRYQRPVVDILTQALPWTVFVLLIAIVLTFIIGIGLGAIMAYLEGTRIDTTFSGIAIVASSIPYYIYAILLVYLLGFQLSVFPIGGRYGNTIEPGLTVAFITSVLYHAALPVISFLIAEVGGQALTMRGNAVRVLGEDFMRVGRLRGLSKSRLALRYVTHNAILPMYTGLMIAIGFMFGGAVILEEIFAYPGVGYYMLRGIETRDYPLMMGGFIIITSAVIVSIFIADLTYGKIDPRVSGIDTESYSRASGDPLRSLMVKLRRLFKESGTAEPESTRTANGGQSEFNAVSDIEMSWGDRFYYKLELWILTPLRILWSDWRGRTGFAIVAGYLLMGTVGVVLISPPKLNTGPRILPPFQTLAFPLGTDGTGKGILAQIIHATPTMLKMTFSGAVFATVVGTVVGTAAGYIGGRMDKILTTITDMAMTIPGLPLVIILAATLQPREPLIVGIILTVNAWAGLARAIRSQVLTLRDQEFVEASRVMGVPTSKVMSYDLIPNLMPYVLINFVQSARGVIFNSVGLYFLGVLPYTSFNWGVMLNAAYSNSAALYSLGSFHWLFFPMMAIGMLSLGLILLAQSLDQLFNPRLRARHAKAIETDEDHDEGDKRVPTHMG